MNQKLKDFLNVYAIPLVAGVLVAALTRVLEMYPVIPEWTGLSPTVVETFIVGLAVFLAGTMDGIYSNDRYFVEPEDE